jgi:hypothetical protein
MTVPRQFDILKPSLHAFGRSRPEDIAMTSLKRFPLMLIQNRAARSVGSPPPCGEALGVGVAVGGHLPRNNYDPPPQPSPTRGEGADRACRSLIPFQRALP